MESVALPQSAVRWHGLDQLRALAILLVLLFHYDVYYGLPPEIAKFGIQYLSKFGWTGVDLFFVLSGYLICNKLLNDRETLGHIDFAGFYMNRAFRIVPAYFVAVWLYFTFPEVQEGRGLQPIWKFLTFTQNIPIDLFANTFSHAWSLCVEEHFYLLFPVILILVYGRNRASLGVYVVAAVLIAGLLVRSLSWSEFAATLYGRQQIAAVLKYVYYPTYARLDGLLVGVAIAAAFRYRPTIMSGLTRHGNVVLFVGLVWLFGCYRLFGGTIISREAMTFQAMVAGFPLLSMGYGLLVISALSAGSVLNRLKFSPTAAIARYSFSIYLVHKMSNHWVNTVLKAGLELGDVQTFFVCLAAAILAGAALHYTIEKPFLVLRDRLALKRAESRPREARF